jgi:hypothetical protein
MKKSEIVQIILIAFGFFVLIQGISAINEQLVFGLNMRFISDGNSLLFFICGVAILFAVMCLLSYFLLFKSKQIVKLLIKEETENELQINLSMAHILQLIIFIIGLNIIIFRFPNILALFFQLLTLYIDDYKQFKQIVPQGIGSILVYVLGIIFTFKSKMISIWFDKRLES